MVVDRGGLERVTGYAACLVPGMVKSQSLLSAAFAGLAGGAAGLLAMNFVMKQTGKLLPEDSKRELPEGESPSWSLVGEHHQADESATAALGRAGYEQLIGRQPSKQRKQQLGQIVHWSYGLAVGTLFGLIRGRQRSAPVDAFGGLSYGFGLWLLGDMIAVPMLGLSDKPARYVPQVHAQTLIGHFAYGLAAAAATRAVRKLLPGGG